MLQERHDRETLRSVILDCFDRSWGFNRDVRFMSNSFAGRKKEKWWWFINLWSLCESLGRNIYSSTTSGYWRLSSWAAHLVRSDTACYADCRVWFCVDGKRNVKVVIGAKVGVLPRDCTDVSSRHDNKTDWSVATDISHTQNRTKNYTRIRVYKVNPLHHQYFLLITCGACGLICWTGAKAHRNILWATNGPIQAWLVAAKGREEGWSGLWYSTLLQLLRVQNSILSLMLLNRRYEEVVRCRGPVFLVSAVWMLEYRYQICKPVITREKEIVSHTFKFGILVQLRKLSTPTKHLL